MATISACTTTSSVARAALMQNGSVSRPSTLLGLPSMSKVRKVRCSMEVKTEGKISKFGNGAAPMMAAAVATSMSSPATMTLVDERMSTEGTRLPFGLSNNLLGWNLFGVFGLVWSLYIVYTSGLDEDEESGLSL